MNHENMTYDQQNKEAQRCGVDRTTWLNIQRQMKEQKFGIEIEMLVPTEKLVEHSVAVGGYGNRNSIPMTAQGFPKMCVGYDGSLSGYCTDENGRRVATRGIEVSSKILTPADLPMLVEWLEWVNTNLTPKVNKSCGLHIHIDIKGATFSRNSDHVAKFLMMAVKNTATFNTALYAQTGAASRYNTNYGRLINDNEKAQMDEDINRGRLPLVGRTTYLQTRVYNSKGTMEFRAFAATTNKLKVLHHIWTTLALTEMSMYGAEVSNARPRWQGAFDNARDGDKALESFYKVAGKLARQSETIESNFRASRKLARAKAQKFVTNVRRAEARFGRTYTGQ